MQQELKQKPIVSTNQRGNKRCSVRTHICWLERVVPPGGVACPFTASVALRRRAANGTLPDLGNYIDTRPSDQYVAVTLIESLRLEASMDASLWGRRPSERSDLLGPLTL